MNLRKQAFFIILLMGFLFRVSPILADSPDPRTIAMEETLAEVAIQPADHAAIALRFGKIDSIVLPVPARPIWQVGAERTFFVINSSEQATLQTDAALVFLGDHLAAWVEKEFSGALHDDFYAELRLFDSEIYPFLRAVLGSEPNPGIDNDPLVHVLFSEKTGSGILGYFSSRDAESALITPFSNQMDMFILNTSLLTGDLRHISNTLSHEFQHMIHFAHDRNESSIVDEGLSGLTEHLIDNRINTAYERIYLSNPDKSMTNWPGEGSNTPYYGGAFLFFKYLSDRLGLDFLQALIQQPENGMDGVDAALSKYAGNPEELTADTLYTEWITANLLAAIGRPDEKYGYKDYSLPEKGENLLIQSLSCDGEIRESETMQYGVDYYRLACLDGRYEVRFRGDPTASVVRQDPLSGDTSWWSNAVTNSETSLMRRFDFSTIKSGPIILTYDIAYELEPGFDFLYLSWSTDGNRWENLRTEYGTDQNDSGFNLGWGYTGSSGGVVHEKVDLSSFAGERVFLRFDYLTDQAVVQDGALIDNIRIEAIGFFDDAESEAAGWDNSGFVRLFNEIPLDFVLTYALNSVEADTSPAVEFSVLENGEQALFQCDFNKNPHQECLWGISAVNRYSRADGLYRVEVLRTDN